MSWSTALRSAWLLLLGVRTAAADPTPTDLHMRPRPRVAQSADDNGGANSTPTPQPKTPGMRADESSGVANVSETPPLTDEQLAKMAEQEASSGEVITVTGSLVERKELTTPAPISVVDRDKLEAAGVTNVGDILQKLTAQGNAINAQVNNGGDGSTRIDLRSLGANRTLVLINGRRVVPGGVGADDSVDFGAIPLAMIERVEVLKDGASAIYGSDAIAGVVNVITRTDFEGTEATAYSGTSQHGDGTNYDLSLVSGHSSKKGNITFAIGYQKQQPVMSADRAWSHDDRTYNYTTKTTKLTGSTAVPGGQINTDNGGNPITIPGCTSQYCTSNGMGGFRNYMDPTSTSFGDDYNFQPINYLFTPSSRVNMFTTGHYDLDDNIRSFFEVSYNKRASDQRLAEEPVVTGRYGTPISAQSIYNPLGVDIVDYNRRLTEFGPRTVSQSVDTFRTVIGLEGKFSEESPLKNWKWEVSYNYGRTDATQKNTGDLILSHLANALGPSFIDPSAGPTCGTPANPIAGCVPLNLLNPGHVTQDMINYLTFTGISSGFNEQRTALAQAHGKLVDLPNHGDISLAFGGDYRREAGAFTPDPLTSTGDTTGNAQAPTSGAYHAVEGFSELSIVPLSGLPYAQWVEANFATRAYDYNTFGSGATYKAGGLFRTAGGLAFRGTYSTAFRAPSIGELFQGRADSFPGVEDPCDTNPPSGPTTLSPQVAAECAREGVPANKTFGTGQQRSSIGGNPNLKPETANVKTAGVVYEPLKGLAFTLDYWNIALDHSIVALPETVILSNCYQHGIRSYCNQIQRDPVTHAISYIIDPINNVGGLTTSGTDFSVAYSYKTSLGQFRHALEGTYLFRYNVDTGSIGANGKDQILHGKGVYDLGVLPDLKSNIFTTWNHPSGIGAGFNLRFIDSFHECFNNDCNDPSNSNLVRTVPKYVTADVFADYTIKDTTGTTRFSLGVNNVANVDPPAIYTPRPNSDASAYDFMGRYYYARVSQLF
jgi:outer membrane receptor protein involved in Fe transport